MSGLIKSLAHKNQDLLSCSLHLHGWMPLLTMVAESLIPSGSTLVMFVSSSLYCLSEGGYLKLGHREKNILKGTRGQNGTVGTTIGSRT